MRDASDRIEAAGAKLAVVGNGARPFAEAFREQTGYVSDLFVDPELKSYRAAGLRRGRVEVFSPRLATNAVRAFAGGSRQGAVQGDPWQLGGVFVIRPDGSLALRHVSREAGDHPAVEDVLAALRPDAPAVGETEPTSAVASIAGRALGAVLDPTVVLSFDRTGFFVHSLGFDPADLDVDLDGRHAVVTGANQGLGLAAATALADLGARVSVVGRSPARTAEAAARIRTQTGNRAVEAVELDVSDLAAVAEVGARLAADRVDVLIHNAGGLPDRRIESPQGLETTLATHVAGPFLLTSLLAPALERSDDARVVWVSSGGMYATRLDFEDVDWRERDYDGVAAYAQTKRMQVVLAELWAERFAGTSVAVNAMHPGWADTGGVRQSLPTFRRVTRAILRDVDQGADTIVWLAASDAARAHRGRFFLDRQPRSTHYLPWTKESDADRRRLWALCEDLTASFAAARAGEPDDDEEEA